MRSANFGLCVLAAMMVIALGLPASSEAQQPVSSDAKTQRETKLKELLKERLETARALEKQVNARVKGATERPEELIAATRIANEAALDLCESDMQRIDALESYLAAATVNERLITQFFKTGQAQQSSALNAIAERLRVQIALERARIKGAKKQGERQTGKKLDDHVALAEKQLAVKQAALRVAAAQKKQALARLNTLKAQVAEARATESFREKQFKRIEDLVRANAVDARTADETRAQYDAAKARREAAEGNLAEAEIQAELDQARHDLAQAEVDEAQLRLNQLKEK
jgi:hypothetical protein